MEVPIDRISRELQALFASDDADHDSGISRASVINLAIYEESTDSLEEAAAVVGEIVQEAACRSILIGADAHGEISARAWVQAHCNIVGRDERKTVCTEQLAFKLTGATPGLVRNTVFAHLDSDLPLVFWWRGEFSEVFSDRLFSRIDRLVFDSRCWEEPRSQFLRLKQALKEDNATFVPHDLSFTRLNPIRSAIAKCFDNPEASKEAGRIEKIEISHGKDHRMPAVYLTAWLASRLRCELDLEQSTRETFRFNRVTSSDASGLTFNLKSIDEGPQSIREVTLHSSRAKFSLKRTCENQFWEMKTEIEGCPDRTELIPMREGKDSVLLTEILMRGGRNHILGDVLNVVREMLVI